MAKEFSWDTDVWIETVNVDEYTHKEIHICSLKGKEFVSFTTIKKIKGEWRPTGGFTIPKSVWGRVTEAVDLFDASNKILGK